MAEQLQGEEAWRERAEQLEVALESRVVIEQAKGMLRERLGLAVDTSFELLRAAARGNGQKLHALALEVVRSFATPEPIVRVLGLHPEFFQVMSRERRILETEEFYRGVNQVIAEKTPRDGLLFLCECANPFCNVTFEMSADDLLLLHSTAGHYVIVPGHEIPDLEEVVQQRDGYAILRKRDVAPT
jgi:hypothetical protein